MERTITADGDDLHQGRLPAPGPRGMRWPPTALGIYAMPEELYHEAAEAALVSGGRPVAKHHSDPDPMFGGAPRNIAANAQPVFVAIAIHLDLDLGSGGEVGEGLDEDPTCTNIADLGRDRLALGAQPDLHAAGQTHRPAPLATLRSWRADQRHNAALDRDPLDRLVGGPAHRSPALLEIVETIYQGDKIQFL